jgi:hypothetical protein
MKNRLKIGDYAGINTTRTPPDVGGGPLQPTCYGRINA